MFNRCTSWCASAGSKCPTRGSPSVAWSRNWATCSNSSNHKTTFKHQTTGGSGSEGDSAGRPGKRCGPQNLPQISICFCSFTETVEKDESFSQSSFILAYKPSTTLLVRTLVLINSFYSDIFLTFSFDALVFLVLFWCFIIWAEFFGWNQSVSLNLVAFAPCLIWPCILPRTSECI